jgi:hypothetical protein
MSIHRFLIRDSQALSKLGWQFPIPRGLKPKELMAFDIQILTWRRKIRILPPAAVS